MFDVTVLFQEWDQMIGRKITLKKVTVFIEAFLEIKATSDRNLKTTNLRPFKHDSQNSWAVQTKKKTAMLLAFWTPVVWKVLQIPNTIKASSCKTKKMEGKLF